jgi:hypothetical protein
MQVVNHHVGERMHTRSYSRGPTSAGTRISAVAPRRCAGSNRSRSWNVCFRGTVRTARRTEGREFDLGALDVTTSVPELGLHGLGDLERLLAVRVVDEQHAPVPGSVHDVVPWFARRYWIVDATRMSSSGWMK